jgi:hypothetical protein
VSGSFQVDPDQIDAAGRELIAQAEALESTISRFGSAAQNISGAFGNLGESDQAEADYLTMTRDTIESLRKVRETIELSGEGLRTTANNYRVADADSNPLGG